MSLYNALFGVNPASGVLLACLGLKLSDVGRFRDCYLDGDTIVIHTRNGGGNRECIHNDGEGDASCKGDSFEREEDEYVYDKEKFTYRKTGNRIMQTIHRCEAPNSEECGCYGCAIQYRLPKHPNYLDDMDDDFDSTYADIRFSFPAEYAADLKAASEQAGEPVTPSAKWQLLLASMKAEATQ